ncbi:hypothetical protein ACFU44_17445 [Nocardia rhizosphaerihabitans]|uniref:hypothetical protein n=1 Tax=Nocardia rhizosphaerihabitans TaxID=1691570 RepID=UPI00366F5D6C
MKGRRPLPRSVCPRCGKLDRCTRQILDESSICDACYLRFRRNAQLCPHCLELKVLAFHDDRKQPACAACTGNEPMFGCPGCGREDQRYGSHCARCTLAERATRLLADHSGRIHPRLQPVFDAWMAGHRHQTTLTWLIRRSSCPEILQAMAQGELPISHATFDELPSTRNINYIRDLLTATGVIEPYDPRVARAAHWINDLLSIMPKHHADLVERFARWKLLRRMHLLEAQGRITNSTVENARADFLGALRLLIWLDDHGLALAEANQHVIDRYLAEFPSRRCTIARFIDWTNQTCITDELHIPEPPRPDIQVVLGDEQRWGHVETLLHDTTIRRYSRIAGLFMLLFAQPLSRICRMTTDQVKLSTDAVSVTFDTIPVEMPEPLDQLLREHLEHPGLASYANRGIWLFPGRMPGRHLVSENIRGELVGRGIQPNHARKAALFSLAATMPTPVLAELLGLSNTTAGRWAALSASSWAQYTADRADSLRGR